MRGVAVYTAILDMITHAVAGSVVVVAAVVVDANAATQVAATSISVGHASRVLTNRGRGVGAAKCAPVEGKWPSLARKKREKKKLNSYVGFLLLFLYLDFAIKLVSTMKTKILI